MTDISSPLAHIDGFSQHKNVRSILVRDARNSFSPLVSIMIPTYRRPDLLKESVKSALSQITTVPFEVVVVDNDSELERANEVEKVIASFEAPNLRYFRNEMNVGLYGNWNRCIELARGRWITNLNDDDLLDQTFLNDMLGIVATDPSIKLVGCSARVLDTRNNVPPATFLTRAKDFARNLSVLVGGSKPRKVGVGSYFLAYPHHGSLGILMDRQAAIEMGGYSPDFHPVSDYLFLSRFVLLHDVRYLPKVLTTYRIAVNVSINKDVCVGGVHLELKLREALIPYINSNAKLLRYYSRLVAVRAVSVFKKRWCPDLDVDVVLKREGLEFKPAVFQLIVTRSLLRLTFLLASKRHNRYVGNDCKDKDAI